MIKQDYHLSYALLIIATAIILKAQPALIPIAIILLAYKALKENKNYKATLIQESSFPFLNIFQVFFGLITISITVSMAMSLIHPSITILNRIGISPLLESSWDAASIATKNIKIGIIVPLSGTILITIISLLHVIPVAIIMASQTLLYINKRFKPTIKILMNISASVPSVVYGYFGMYHISPKVFYICKLLGIDVSYENAFCASITIAMMVLPIMFALIYDAMSNIPKNTIYGAYALGCTKLETTIYLIYPIVSKHIISSILITISRIIAETMIVSLTAGSQAYVNLNPFREVNTITTQIINLLNDGESADSNLFLMSYVLGLLLFIICLAINITMSYLRKTKKAATILNIAYTYRFFTNKKRMSGYRKNI